MTAEQRNEQVILKVMVAQEDSWAKAEGKNRLACLPMSLVRPLAWAPREPKEDRLQKCRSLCGSPQAAPGCPSLQPKYYR